MSVRVTPGTAFAACCLGIAIFSCMDAVMKGLSIAIGAYNAMLWRSLLGVLFNTIVFVCTRQRWPSRDILWLHILRSGAAGLSVLLFFWGLVRVPMAEGVALTFLSPVVALLLAGLLLGEHIRRSAIFASLLAIGGVGVIVAGKAQAGADAGALAGSAAIVVASLLYAYSLVLTRQSALVAGPIEITFFMHLVFTLIYLPAAPLLAEVPAASHWPALTAAAVLASVSSILISWAYAHAEAQRLVVVEYTAFLWAALLGALVFGERVSALTVAGAALIVGGCLIAARDRNAAPGPVSEAAA